MNKKDTIAILGLGKVGTAVGFLLKSSGYKIAAVADCSSESLNCGLPYIREKAFTNFSHAASLADSIIITTPDDVIMQACDEISDKGCITPGKKVIHMSGAGGLDLLQSARDCGAYVASIHPIQSFADIKGAIDNIPGSTFGITSDEEMKNWATQVVEDLGGTFFFVSEKDKPLYHAAACVASNYLVALMNIAVEIYKTFGLEDGEAVKAFWPLVKGTIKNIENKGTIKSLTGPIARGDIGTINKHTEAFRSSAPVFMDLYSLLGTFTVDIALKNKSLTKERAQEIILLLEGRKYNE